MEYVVDGDGGAGVSATRGEVTAYTHQPEHVRNTLSGQHPDSPEDSDSDGFPLSLAHVRQFKLGGIVRRYHIFTDSIAVHPSVCILST